MGLNSEIIGSALRLFLWAFIELKALCLCWHSCIKAFFLLVIKKNITLRVLRRERIRHMQILLLLPHMHTFIVIMCRLLEQPKHPVCDFVTNAFVIFLSAMINRPWSIKRFEMSPKKFTDSLSRASHSVNAFFWLRGDKNIF